MESRQKQILQY
jgi:DNA primase